MSRQKGTPVYVMIILSALCTLISCTSGDMQSSPGHSAKDEKPDITIETAEGKTFSLYVERNQLPPQWPKDIPLIPESTILYTHVENTGKAQLTASTSRNTKEISSFYWKELQSRGWRMKRSSDPSGMPQLTASKENKESTIHISDSGTLRTLQITVQGKKLN